MENPKIIICDCDHADTNPEHNVFTQAGVEYKRLQCTSQEQVLAECQGAVVFLNQYVRMDENIFKNIPSLKLVVRYGVGVDNVNLADATKYGVQVTNVPDYGMHEVADQALALMMSLVRKICFLDKRVHQGVWDYREVVPIRRLSECTIGVVGLGRIGSAFAHRASAMGSKIIGFDRAFGRPGRTFPQFVEPKDTLEEMLEEADIVSLHCDLNEFSSSMMNKERFARMKEGAYLINTARGGIIDEAALVDALKSGRLGGAGLDVTVKEPISKDHPLLAFDNVIITPHSGWYSEEAAVELKRKCAEDAVNFISGRPVKYPVNKL